MTKEILDNITYIKKRHFPKKELETIIENKEEYIPELIKVLEDTYNNVEELAEKENYFLHIYAIYLLAEFKETKALKVILDLVKLPGDTVDSLLGDIITMDLSAILASFCNKNITPIKELIENPEVFEYVRGSAVASLSILAAQNIITREEVINYFRELFQTKLEKEPVEVWNNLVNECCNLYPEELMDYIKEAYELGLIDALCISPEDVEDALRQGKEETLKELKNHTDAKCNIDTIKSLKSWYCFK